MSNCVEHPVFNMCKRCTALDTDLHFGHSLSLDRISGTISLPAYVIPNHGRPQACARGHLPPSPPWKCWKVFWLQSRRSICASFWENVVPPQGSCPWTLLGDVRPSDPLTAHPWKKILRVPMFRTYPLGGRQLLKTKICLLRTAALLTYFLLANLVQHGPPAAGVYTSTLFVRTLRIGKNRRKDAISLMKTVGYRANCNHGKN